MVDLSIIIEKDIYIVNEADRFLITKGGKSAISVTKSLSPQIKKEIFEPKYEKMGFPIDGILGVIEAKDSNYLVVIDKTTLIGTIVGHKVFSIDHVTFLSYENSNKQPSVADEFHINQVRDFLKRNSLYFSNTLDLSVSIHQIAKNSRGNSKTNDSNLFRNSKVHFLWNYSNTRSLDDELLVNIVHPTINGYIGIQINKSYDTHFTFCLISRKDNRRSGCRFIVRGADSNGYVANFVESEQIVTIDSNKGEVNVLSYLQIRGSIPLIWNQVPNLQLNPPIYPSTDNSAQSNAYNRHLTEIVSEYSKVALVNLIDKKGFQNVLGDTYQTLFKNSKNLFQSNTTEGLEQLVDYTWFDFHSECKKMKYQNLSKLLKTNSVSSAISNQDFTQISINSKFTDYSKVKVISIQNGVFRTNCIDNLDRTNVVQGVFARQFLHKIFYRLKLSELPSGNPFEEFLPGFESTYKNLWSANGDYISKAYSGTNALKRDFTRTGKRTMAGAVEDGVNSCTRFYINNFCDGYNQDCHDYYLGLLNPKKKNFKSHSTLLVNALIISVIISSFLFYNMSVSLCLNENSESEFSIRRFAFKCILFLGIFTTTAISYFNGFKNSIIDNSTIQYH